MAINRYVAQIPARIGSKRVKMKNLRLMNNKPMIQYAIDACQLVDSIGRVFVNTDSDIIGNFAESIDADYYPRKPELANDNAKQDEFNYDFLKNIDCEAMIMVNPVSPLVEADDIRAAIEKFEHDKLDTLIACRQERLHSFFEGEPLNFNSQGKLPATQDISAVDICTWTVCIWRKSTFIESFEKHGYAAFSGKVGLFPISPINTLKVSYEADFQLAEHIMRWRNNEDVVNEIKYYTPED